MLQATTSPRFEFNMVLRDRNGKPTGKRATFKTNNTAFLAERGEKEFLLGVKPRKQEAAINKFYGQELAVDESVFGEPLPTVDR